MYKKEPRLIIPDVSFFPFSFFFFSSSSFSPETLAFPSPVISLFSVENQHHQFKTLFIISLLCSIEASEVKDLSLELCLGRFGNGDLRVEKGGRAVSEDRV